MRRWQLWDSLFLGTNKWKFYVYTIGQDNLKSGGIHIVQITHTHPQQVTPGSRLEILRALYQNCISGLTCLGESARLSRAPVQPPQLRR